MSLVAGIDYSSNAIHVAMLDTDSDRAHWHVRRIDDATGDSFERARRVRDVMPARGSWLDSGVVLVGIESTYSQSFKATAALARVQGAILACLPPGIPVLPVTAQEWKRVTIGKSNASKEEVAAWASERWGALAPVGVPQDVWDAYCIAYAVRDLCDKAAAA